MTWVLRLVLLLLPSWSVVGREWTRESGQTIKFLAEMRGIDGANVILQASDGRTAAFPLAQFSMADREFVKTRLTSLVLDSMPVIGIGQKAGAGWGKPLSADPADCVVTEVSGGFRSRHFTFFCDEKLPAAAMRDVAESCEVVHELFRVAPWGLLAAPQKDGRFEVALLPHNAMEMNGHVFDAKGPMRVAYGAAGLTQIDGEWVCDERPGASRRLKECTALMLMRDVMGLVPPWLPEALADCISEIPTAGGTAWCVEGRAVLERPGTVDMALMQELFTPPALLPPGVVMTVPAVTVNSDGTINDPREAARKKKAASAENARMAARYFIRMVDGWQARQLTQILRGAKEDNQKWQDYDAGVKKYQEEFEAFKVAPGVVALGGGRYRYPSTVKAPVAPVPPHVCEDTRQMPWLLLPALLEGKNAADLATAIANKLRVP